jgi:hypothetical protein
MAIPQVINDMLYRTILLIMMAWRERILHRTNGLEMFSSQPQSISNKHTTMLRRMWRIKRIAAVFLFFSQTRIW